MYTIGLTGGMGAGKSYAAALFHRFGIPDIDTDAVAREVTSSGSACLDELSGYFGADIINADGSLDRKKLAALAFASEEKTRILNAVTHRYILNKCRDWLRRREEEGCFAAVVQAPLLYESGFNYRCDYVAAVLCDTETKIKRVTARSGLSREETLARLSRQHDDIYFSRRADFLLYNNDGDNLYLQIDLVVQQIKFV